jgi:hypothetical protein
MRCQTSPIVDQVDAGQRHQRCQLLRFAIGQQVHIAREHNLRRLLDAAVALGQRG